MRVCVYAYMCSGRSKEGVGCHRTAVTGRCEPPGMSVKN